jgi:pantetheine-phosphate adenylyltransferase
MTGSLNSSTQSLESSTGQSVDELSQHSFSSSLSQRASERFKELTSDNKTRELLQRLIDATVSPGPTNNSDIHFIARQLAEDNGDTGKHALEAALLFGGILHQPAFNALHELVNTNQDPLARQILRCAYDKRAIYPGSFDPVTLGHLDVMRRAALIFEEIIVGIGINPDKRCLFSPQEKIDLITHDLKDIPGSFQVMAFKGLTTVLAEEMNIGTIVRGVRSITDGIQEQELAEVNRRQSHEGHLNTFFIPTQLDLTFTSSSVARVLASYRNGDPSPYLSEATNGALLNKLQRTTLEAKWMSIFGDSPETTSLFNRVCDSYQGETRHYHNLRHIFDMFLLLDENKEYIQKNYQGSFQTAEKIIGAAIFFHDIVYVSREKDNEARSAALLVSELTRLRWPVDHLQHAADLVLATIKHAAVEGREHDPLTKIFLDLDLAILGASAHVYQRYTAAIRKEYSQYGELDYCEGRRNVMERFASKPRHYLTDEMNIRFGRKAHENLRAELEFLGRRIDLLRAV